MASASRVGAERLVGFDAAGEAFIADGRILRGIYAGHAATYRNIVAVCEDADLFASGIVGTRILEENPHPELSYELVLEHERVPFVTYPHEWPAPMLKAAAVFHIDLFATLSSCGLCLKDWHPYNVLFRATEPVFVDFTSLIKQERLKDEPYLNSDAELRRERSWDSQATYIYEMYRRMYVPYFLLPLYMMSQGRHAEARSRMLATALNTADSTITVAETFRRDPIGRVRYQLSERRKRAALSERGAEKSAFFALLRRELEALTVSVSSSGYSSYYAAKNEQSDFEPSVHWSAKQIAVHDTLRRFHPETVLDIGSNTGWFSVLASKQGASVVALDIDEASIDILYAQAHAEGLSILPLVLNVADPTPDVPARTYSEESSLSLIGGDTPLLRSTQHRLRCDTVFALALVHHLALGRGIPVGEIAAMLSAYTRRNLVVEFVAAEDPLIVAEPTFFAAYSKAPGAFSEYTLGGFTAALAKFFPSIEARTSNPATRTLLLCSK